MAEKINPQPSQDTLMEIGQTAAELYAKHKEVGEAQSEAGTALQEAMAAERAGEGPAEATIVAGSTYREAGTANAKSLLASRDHFRANQDAYVEMATQEAQAVGNEVNGPVAIAKQVEPSPDQKG